MKLIVAGATGLVGTEIIHQSLKNPKIKSVIALGRRPTFAPESVSEDIDTSKLENIVLEDFTKYPNDIRKLLADADACIWALAITPLKSRAKPWDEVVQVNQDYPLAGLEAIAEARGARSAAFRFMYISGDGASRDPSKKPALMGDYLLLRGDTENKVLAFASEHKSEGFEACVAKPGLISSPGTPARNVFITVAGWAGTPIIDVSECVTAMIDQVMNGFEKDPLLNADLIRLGQNVG